MLIDRLIKVPSLVSMISRGPISGSTGTGADVAGSGLGVRLAAVELRLVVVRVPVFGFAASVASPFSSVFEVSSTAGASIGFGFTGTGETVQIGRAHV